MKGVSYRGLGGEISIKNISVLGNIPFQCFQAQYQQIYEQAEKLLGFVNGCVKEDLPEIEGLLSGPSTPMNWKLARDQRNELVHGYPWVDMWPALKRVIEPVALGVRELERTDSNLLTQVKNV
jgi:hypothetical protein